MFGEKKESEEGSKQKKVLKENSRGAKDDWESIKLCLDDMPSLKQRVLHKIREIKRSRDEASNPKTISMKEQRDFRLKEKAQQKK